MIYLSRLVLVLLCGLGLTACDRDAPSCSSAATERTVSQINTPSDFYGLVPAVNVRFGDQLFEVHLTYDQAKLGSSMHFVYANEREDSYDPTIKKRMCVADMSFSYDPSIAADGIIVDPQATLVVPDPNGIGVGQRSPVTLTAEQIATIQIERARLLDLGPSVVYGPTIHYSVQLTDNGDTYIAVYRMTN